MLHFFAYQVDAAGRRAITGSSRPWSEGDADNTYSEEDMKKWQRAQNIKRAWLEDDEYLISAEGSRVQVVSITRHSSVDRPMVWLQSEFFKIPVTQSPSRDAYGQPSWLWRCNHGITHIPARQCGLQCFLVAGR